MSGFQRNRGHGAKRGGTHKNVRGGGGSYRQLEFDPDLASASSHDYSGSSRGSNERYNDRSGRHPAHLRGRDIGMFYARKNRNKKPKLFSVKLDQHKEEHFSHMLNVIKGTKTTELPSEISDFQHDYETHLNSNNSSVDETTGLQRNAQLDKQLQNEISDLEKSSKYRRMLEFREKLPAFAMREQIVELISSNQVVVISGETGCGKTTQVSQFILDSQISKGRGSLCHVVCTQPRRISAISVAERVADERAESCGNGKSSVGWQIRLEKKLPRKAGSILFCTTGILLQHLKSDSLLGGISHVILDEIHERDLDTDFLMIILKDLIAIRPDMKLILMSATLNALGFSKYFGSCPMLNIPGLTFPVTRYYLEDVFEQTGYIPETTTAMPKRTRGGGGPRRRNHKEDFEPFYRSLVGKYSPQTIDNLRNWDDEKIDIYLIVTLLRHICTKQKDGAVLIFLPGWDQINKLNTELLRDQMFRNHTRFLLIPLHSMMPTINQKFIFEKAPPGVRKIIMSTNIAETSITIDDVVFVIDTGKVKMNNFDVVRNVETLKPEWVAIANAKQRKGRAGRVQEGVCYHLFTKGREMLLAQYALPEILRTRLETLCLKIKILKLGKIAEFLCKARDPPIPESVHLSIDLLTKLNALDSNEMLTPLGFHLARLPLDPLTGRMILFGAMFSCLDPILTIAASLSFKDPFYTPLGLEKIVDERKRELASNTCSDHLMLAKVFKDWERACETRDDQQFCRHNFLSGNNLKMLKSLKVQFAEYLHDLQFIHSPNPKLPDFNQNSTNELLLKAVICAGLYPNVATIRHKVFKGEEVTNKKPSVSTQGDGKVCIHPRSVNCRETYFPSPWLVYYQKVKSTEIFLHDTTMVHPYALLFFGGKLTTGKSDDQETISVDEWINFSCASQTAKIIMELRAELENLLEYKISNPNAYFWSFADESREKMVLQSIMDLITSEISLSSYGVWSAGFDSDS